MNVNPFDYDYISPVPNHRVIHGEINESITD